MKSSVILHQLISVRPRYEYPQSYCLDWLAEYYHALKKSFPGSKESVDLLPVKSRTEADELRRMQVFFRRFGCSPDRIAKRGFDLNDFQNKHFEEGELYVLPRKGMISSLQRTSLYQQFADQHFAAMYSSKSCERAPHHIFHVTCTGYVSPSPAQTLVDDLGWHGKTDVTHFYHMGCYGAMPAVRMAQAVVGSNPDKRVDIVHTELCSLHLDAQELTPEQAVVQSLFGDGAIRYSAVMDPMGRSVKGLEVVDIREMIVPHTRELMSWKVGDSGMIMNLSRDVPAAVVGNLKKFLSDMVQLPHELSEKSYKKYLFAIHPGGPRIIDTIQEVLGLTHEQVAHSVAVLQSFGNMSSATLPHVWQKIVEDPEVPHGQEVISLAFGPGLTIFGALMKKVS